MWLVIGYGNSLYADDRFGIDVAEELRTRLAADDIEVISGDLLKPEWAEPISRADGVIFVDASDSLPPGKLQCLGLDPVLPIDSARSSIFTHYATPEMLLAAARVLYGRAPLGWLYMVGGEDFSLGEKLSPTVKRMVPRTVALILERVHPS